MHANRRQWMQWVSAAAVVAASARLSGCSIQPEAALVMETTSPIPARMPVLFLGHGTPMNAIEDNRWSQAFQALGGTLPRPKAILAISAHWWTQGTFLTGNAAPRTIHDFGGFPQELFEVQYPSPGSPDVAARIRTLLAAQTSPPAALADDWGLDHGTWSVLRHMVPAADVPVVQLSLDGRLSSRQHFELARALQALREEGVLLLGSGNITHNLRDAMGRAARGEATTPDWALAFDRDVAQAILQRDGDHLVDAWPDGRHARQAHPHPDHWFPLLYAFAATDDRDGVSFPIEGFDLGSLSMRAVRWG